MNVSAKSLLVTGASGFLGSEVVSLALAEGWKVRAFGRSRGRLSKDIEFVAGDLGDIGALGKACRGISAVVHAAGRAHVFGREARDSETFDGVNEAGTAHVVRAALGAGASQLVLASSVSVYGGYSGAWCSEDQACDPKGVYALSKWKGEQRAILEMAGKPGCMSILRLATIYGEGDQGNVAKLIRLLDGGWFVWPGNGHNRKSLIYKTDAARACLLALQSPFSGVGVFNVSSPAVTMREIVTAICSALARPVPGFRIPQHLLAVASALWRHLGDPGKVDERLDKFLCDDVYDHSKFHSAFGFQPSVSLREGIHREVQHIRKSNDDHRP